MKNQNIILATPEQDPCSFGGSASSWTTNSVKKIQTYLEREGFNVKLSTIQNLNNEKMDKDDVIVYTSSPVLELREYIKDKLYFVSLDREIIPSYQALLAHENKGFQSIYRERKKIGNLKESYATRIENLEIPLPIVKKEVTGAGSSGVSLIKTTGDIFKFKKLENKKNPKRLIKNLIRKTQLSNSEFEIYVKRYEAHHRVVAQEFIEKLDHDYKILIFGDKLYPLRREVRKDDFRASGSGKISFTTPPDSILDYASDIFKTLNEPYASLDIAHSDAGCHLIEYQILNFGPTALLKSSGYFKKNKKWVFHEETPNLEKSYAEAIAKYLRKGRLEKPQ